MWIDRWDNKEYTRPDVLDFTFNVEGSSDILADGKFVFSYATFAPTSDTSGETQTVGCMIEIGNSENYQIFNWKGSSAFESDDLADAALNEQRLDEATDADDSDNFRESYNEYDYMSSTWDDNGDSKTYCPCKASLEIPKIGRDDDMFTDYTVKVGQRIYDT